MKVVGSAFAALTFSVLVTNPLQAQPAAAPMTMPMASQPSTGQGSMTSGELRKVDLAAHKLTLNNGDFKNLGMPGMTMVFKVLDPKLISEVKEGDKIRFTADRVGGALTVTSIEMAKQ